MSGDPCDRPLLVDFANLITKRLSLLELVHIVDESIDNKMMQQLKDRTDKWLHENHIKGNHTIQIMLKNWTKYKAIYHVYIY